MMYYNTLGSSDSAEKEGKEEGQGGDAYCDQTDRYLS
jgi:hypothetical protein